MSRPPPAGEISFGSVFFNLIQPRYKVIMPHQSEDGGEQ